MGLWGQRVLQAIVWAIFAGVVAIWIFGGAPKRPAETPSSADYVPMGAGLNKPSESDRIDALERRVDTLEADVTALKHKTQTLP